jgi:hypothetical protein
MHRGMYRGRNFGCNFGVGATSGPVWRPIRTFSDNRMAGNRAKKYQYNLALHLTKTVRKYHGLRLIGVHLIGVHPTGGRLMGGHLTGGHLTGMYPQAWVLWAGIL